MPLECLIRHVFMSVAQHLYTMKYYNKYVNNDNYYCKKNNVIYMIPVNISDEAMEYIKKKIKSANINTVVIGFEGYG